MVVPYLLIALLDTDCTTIIWSIIEASVLWWYSLCSMKTRYLNLCNSGLDKQCKARNSPTIGSSSSSNSRKKTQKGMRCHLQSEASTSEKMGYLNTLVRPRYFRPLKRPLIHWHGWENYHQRMLLRQELPKNHQQLHHFIFGTCGKQEDRQLGDFLRGIWKWRRKLLKPSKMIKNDWKTKSKKS